MALTQTDNPTRNVAVSAEIKTSFVSGHESLSAINDGFAPRNSRDRRHGVYGNWPMKGTQWVEYQWSKPIATKQVEVYWFEDRQGIRLPVACRLKYWNGSELVPVPNAKGLGVLPDTFNTTTFDEIQTTRLRLEFDSDQGFSTGIIEFRVIDSGKSSNFPPTAQAGKDRYVTIPGLTYLNGKAKDDGKPNGKLEVKWVKKSGPGDVVFGSAESLQTTASFSKPGKYSLSLVADDGTYTVEDTIQVIVEAKPASHWSRVETSAFSVTGSFMRPRLKNQIVNWIPYLIKKIEDPNTREGGLDNFVQAARKVAGATDARHQGPVFANAWVHNTLEAMCLAMMVDPKGDAEIKKAQSLIKASIDRWVKVILAAQEPDGYLNTLYTISGHPRWTNLGDHEGYVMGYFIDAALAHYEYTKHKDRRLYDAAKKTADLWCANFGPAPKKKWYDGHQAIEQALVHLGQTVNRLEGTGKGRKYIELAKFLLDSRGNGSEYDQSHLPVTQQYEAVGHSVRAAYNYNGMALVAIETGDTDYYSAVKSLWNSVVNKKYYITGGLGSGETSEGFGPEFSLGNHSYCESCAGCGELFFQHSMGLAYRDAQYAGLVEDVLYNNVLGSVDLDGKHFTYTNALDSSEGRYLWHACPCCVGNIPRTLLNLPSWQYAAGPNELAVNLFSGGRAFVGKVAGADLSVEQATDYPNDGKVSIMLEPSRPVKFRLLVRIPNRKTSGLYTPAPDVSGIIGLKVNGKPVKAKSENGYAVIEREWHAGDSVAFTVPLKVQVVKADPRIKDNVGRVALRYGPMVFNIESVDQDVEKTLDLKAPLKAVYDAKLLGGVMTIRGKFTDGTPFIAVPNYARLNRGGRSIVWIKAE